MKKNLSEFAERFLRPSGTKQLMDDLDAVANAETPIVNLGGGNPGLISDVHRIFTQRLHQAMNDNSIDDVIRRYDGPQGHRPFRRALASMLNRQYGWPVSEDNIATTAGSQTSFFMLFNAFAGVRADGTTQQVMLPLTPEYIGYTDVGLSDDMIRSKPARIEKLNDNTFKYRLDFKSSDLSDDIGVVCVSRPTNPTGNVITNDEIQRLVTITKSRDVPFIIDGAYGLPFPNIVFADAEPYWDDHVILCLSLSKIGLPGLRTGVVVANPDVIEMITSMNAIFSLANNPLGAHLVAPLMETNELLDISNRQINPFYKQKSLQALQWCHQHFAGMKYFIHQSEGAIFLWLWFPDLPITDLELYERLKEQGVLVLPGQYFFPNDDGTAHTKQCLRLSYAQDPKDVEHGIRLIAQELKQIGL